MKSMRSRFTIGFGLLLMILLAVMLLVWHQWYDHAGDRAAAESLQATPAAMWTLLFTYIGVVGVGWLAAWWFAKRVLRPLETLKHSIQHISPDNLQERIAQETGAREVDALANQFNQMLDKVQDAFVGQKDFVHYASHELRTPIAAMISLTESSLDRGYAADKLEQVLRQLYQQQTSLANITNSLLLLTDRKPVENTHPRIRIDELVFRSVEVVQQLFPTAHIQVDLDVNGSGESALLIKGNEPLLMIAFSNLLKNAIQYSDNNAAIVILKLQEATKEVIFRNTGELFSPEEQQLIYEPFYRGKNARKKSGHGLGLAIVKQIADIHKAEIKYHHDGQNVFSFCFSDIDACDND